MADTQINQTTGNGDGRGGLYVVLVILVVLIIVGIMFFGPWRGGDAGNGADIDADIRIEAPETPAAPGGNGAAGGPGDGGEG